MRIAHLGCDFEMEDSQLLVAASSHQFAFRSFGRSFLSSSGNRVKTLSLLDCGPF